MAENKTKPTEQSAADFINSVEDPQKRADSMELIEMMRDITGAEPKVWGDSIIGFGDYHYKYASGREGDWFLAGFSPRKQSLTIYITGYLEFFEEELKDLGKFKHGKGCLYIKRLEEININILRKLIEASIERLSSN